VPLAYISSGNHENYGNFDTFMEKIASLGIKILKMNCGNDGVQIIGMNTKKPDEKSYYRKLLSEPE